MKAPPLDIIYIYITRYGSSCNLTYVHINEVRRIRFSSVSNTIDCAFLCTTSYRCGEIAHSERSQISNSDQKQLTVSNFSNSSFLFLSTTVIATFYSNFSLHRRIAELVSSTAQCGFTGVHSGNGTYVVRPTH